MVKVFSAMEPLLPHESDLGLLRERARLIDSSVVLDGCLVGYASQWPQNWVTASYVLADTKRVKLIIAHRPGVMHPALAARTASTLDMLSDGRVALNIVAGGSVNELHREGDYLPKENRYARAIEYVQLMRRIWTSSESFSHEGEFFRGEHLRQFVRPVAGTIPIFMGGESEGAVNFGAQCADVYMLWGEPLAETKERVQRIRAAAARYGTALEISLSLRLFMAPTDAKAWSFARQAEEKVRSTMPATVDGRTAPTSGEVGRVRQVAIAEAGDVHDDCFWTGLMKLTGGFGNTAALVGTPDRVFDTMARYRALGIDGFLISTGDGPGSWSPSLEDFAARMKAEL